MFKANFCKSMHRFFFITYLSHEMCWSSCLFLYHGHSILWLCMSAYRVKLWVLLLPFPSIPSVLSHVNIPYPHSSVIKSFFLSVFRIILKFSETNWLLPVNISSPFASSNITHTHLKKHSHFLSNSLWIKVQIFTLAWPLFLSPLKPMGRQCLHSPVLHCKLLQQ